jgi:folate-dependent phosphoribosylglycinamide formyltransferase PurN
MLDKGSGAPQSDIATLSKVAVLTRYDSRFGASFLEELACSGYRPALLVVEQTPFSKRLRQLRSLARRIGWPDALRYNVKFWTPLVLRAMSFARLRNLPPWQSLAPQVLAVRDINDPIVAKMLATHDISTIVLAQSGIIRQAILALDCWILNCHPGKLPEYRGVDVVRWALLEGSDIWVTLHEVDLGVDTGRILVQERVTIADGDTIRDVEQRANRACIRLLIEASVRGRAGLEATAQELDSGRQYYLMPFATAQDLENRWKDLRAAIVARQAVVTGS